MTAGEKRLALLGGRGMLGSDLGPLLEREWKVSVLDMPHFDLCDGEQLRNVVEQNDVIVNCAAYTNVDKAETEPDKAYEVNAAAVARLGEFAAGAGKYVLHISTDFVFDGRGCAPYTEEDVAAPLNVYGASKLEGERLLSQSGCRCCIVRVQWTYGHAGTNFVLKLLERAALSDELMMVDDQFGAPTWTRDVSDVLAQLLRIRRTGLYHMAADGYASRLEVAEFILQQSGIGKKIRACSTSDFRSPAQRPLNSRFNCSKIDKELGKPRPHWRDAMDAFLDELHSATKGTTNV